MADGRGGLSPPGIGLVLGAGSATGYAFHDGVLRALRQSGWEPRTADVVVGTSAGSIVGALLRRPDLRPAGVRGTTVDVPVSDRLPDLSPWLAALRHPRRARLGVLATSLLPAGNRSPELLYSSGQRAAGWPGEPLYVCAVRRRDGRRVVFGRADGPSAELALACAASCAIPGYFTPIEIGGERYVDGGAHSPTNADVLADHGLTTIVVSSPMSIDLSAGRPARLDLLPRLHARRNLSDELGPMRDQGTRVIRFEPAGDLLRVMGVNPMRTDRARDIEQLSYEHATAVLDEFPVTQ